MRWHRLSLRTMLRCLFRILLFHAICWFVCVCVSMCSKTRALCQYMMRQFIPLVAIDSLWFVMALSYDIFGDCQKRRTQPDCHYTQQHIQLTIYYSTAEHHRRAIHERISRAVLDKVIAISYIKYVDGCRRTDTLNETHVCQFYLHSFFHIVSSSHSCRTRFSFRTAAALCSHQHTQSSNQFNFGFIFHLSYNSTLKLLSQPEQRSEFYTRTIHALEQNRKSSLCASDKEFRLVVRRYPMLMLSLLLRNTEKNCPHRNCDSVRCEAKCVSASYRVGYARACTPH